MRTRSSQHINKNGFSLMEMLVSVLIFSFIVVAVYYLFDKGNWMYLHSQSRSNMQDNARLAMEFMERELRMASFGVPAGTNVGGEQTWLPDFFQGGKSEIGFRGDIDSHNAMIKSDVTSGATSITVDYPSNVCPAATPNILIIERGRAWQGTTCTGISGSTITIGTGAAKAFDSEECEVYTPEHVWYRLSPDTNSDGICDLAATGTESTTTNYDNCIIQRCVQQLNSPTSTDTNCTNLWETVATNVRELTFAYYGVGTTGPVSYTSIPLSTANLYGIDKIQVTMEARGRADIRTLPDINPKFQRLKIQSEILIRKRVL